MNSINAASPTVELNSTHAHDFNPRLRHAFKNTEIPGSLEFGLKIRPLCGGKAVVVTRSTAGNGKGRREVPCPMCSHLLLERRIARLGQSAK